jgi:hypothetical protein
MFCLQPRIILAPIGILFGPQRWRTPGCQPVAAEIVGEGYNRKYRRRELLRRILFLLNFSFFLNGIKPSCHASKGKNDQFGPVFQKLRQLTSIIEGLANVTAIDRIHMPRVYRVPDLPPGF